MKANELMIGNWVDIKATNSFIYKRRKITANDLIDSIHRECVYIPLTAEILEKNGFVIEEREGDITFPYLAFIIENDEYRVEITWYDSHDVYEPNTGEYLRSAPEVWNMEILGKCGNYDCGKNKIFVHELQHALRLCGIDKEIVL